MATRTARTPAPTLAQGLAAHTRAPQAAPLVLLFSTTADPAHAARLHAATCNMVNTAGRKVRMSHATGADLADEIADLEERGFPVVRCKCCK